MVAYDRCHCVTVGNKMQQMHLFALISETQSGRAGAQLFKTSQHPAYVSDYGIHSFRNRLLGGSDTPNLQDISCTDQADTAENGTSVWFQYKIIFLSSQYSIITSLKRKKNV